MASPFPGMDPYLEGYLWPDVHNALAAKIRQKLTPLLRPRYTARLNIYKDCQEQSHRVMEVLVSAAAPPKPVPPLFALGGGYGKRLFAGSIYQKIIDMPQTETYPEPVEGYPSTGSGYVSSVKRCGVSNFVWYPYPASSKRSAFMTLFHAATKSCTNFSLASSWA
jgi:hypothetical protein